MEQGRFRADLFSRLNVFPVSMPALRERPADIAPLAFTMLLRHAPKGEAMPWIGDAALDTLRAYPWPGNVRELENVMRRALLLAQGQTEIAPEHIVFDMTARPVVREAASPAPAQGTADVVDQAAGQAAPAKLSKIVKLSEARAIMDTLESVGGHRANAARALGISERTLRYRLASFREAGIAMGAAR